MLSEEGAESKELNGSYELALKIVFFLFQKACSKMFFTFFFADQAATTFEHTP